MKSNNVESNGKENSETKSNETSYLAMWGSYLKHCKYGEEEKENIQNETIIAEANEKMENQNANAFEMNHAFNSEFTNENEGH